MNVPVSSVISLEAAADFVLKAVHVSHGGIILPDVELTEDTELLLLADGEEIEGAEVTIIANESSGEVTGLNVPVVKGTQLDLQLISGTLFTPVVLTLTVDVPTLVSQSDIYEAVKAIVREGDNIEIDEDDDEKTITIHGEEDEGGGVVGTLGTAVYTTETLANNDEETGVVEIAKTFELIRTVADYPSRVRLYSAEQYLLADATRVIGDIPTGEHGVIVDNVFVSGNLQLDQMPIPSGTSAETPRTNEIAIKVQNRSGSSQIIEVTFTYIILEA